MKNINECFFIQTYVYLYNLTFKHTFKRLHTRFYVCTHKRMCKHTNVQTNT